MKTLLFAATILLVSLGASARSIEKQTFICEGINNSVGYKLTLAAKSMSNVENKAIAYWVSLDQPDGIGYEGLIYGIKSDVQLFLKSRRYDNVQVKGTLYMDDQEQLLYYINAQREKIRLELSCDLKL